ncbi:protein kinase [Sorangium sp. So ce216]
MPRFVACDFDRPDPYLAMQFVEGERLGDWLLRNPEAAEREFVLRAILVALEHAHSLGIHHRDLKAENILIAAGPRPFIIDWGGAKTLLPEQQTVMPKFHANIRNSAPECILHVRGSFGAPFLYSAKQDMWSLGVIAYHVLSGRHPFEVPGDPLHTIENVLRVEPQPLPPECGSWGQVAMALLHKDPAKRIASCSDALGILERAATVVVSLDEIVEEVLQDLGDYMVNSDDVLIGEMAMTNAVGFGCDDCHVHSVRYDAVEEVINFETQLHFSGDQVEDQMWCGDAFTVQLRGRASEREVNGVDKWVVDDYQVEECVNDYSGEDER